MSDEKTTVWIAQQSDTSPIPEAVEVDAELAGTLEDGRDVYVVTDRMRYRMRRSGAYNKPGCPDVKQANEHVIIGKHGWLTEAEARAEIAADGKAVILALQWAQQQFVAQTGGTDDV